VAIISASRRTDIPAFFGGWLMERLDAGYCLVPNPFNAHQAKRVDLRRRSVDCLVLWTKNPAPFMEHLDALDAAGYGYYFQYTLNPYPDFMEPGLPPVAQRVETMRRLAERVGPQRVMWRYDPIAVGGPFTVDWHLDQAQRLANELAGSAGRWVVSFLDFYGKTKRRLARLKEERGIEFKDVAGPDHEKDLERLCRGLAGVAKASGLELASCAEELDLGPWGVKAGACVDVELVRRALGLKLDLPKDPGQRPACLCAQSVDIGVYNTCSHGCLYCYANFSDKAIAANLERHRRDGEALVPLKAQAKAQGELFA